MASDRCLWAACRQRRPNSPVIFHSDRGCQYTSHQFACLAAEFGVQLSVGRAGQCWDCQSFRTRSRKDRVAPAAYD
ncbi:DDE-type integrase/transposase/recombinase [Streptomyces sp. ISL-86]|uniref:DDE-type integrase/transposase/recombinase n=1 Tax=Streptomyces sp. ISL-86 TaxID=2819187 RepID=UPI001BE86787|nr:DDE-type integrase/transposase/recombinase [Streptomyces sp. ISL-86]